MKIMPCCCVRMNSHFTAFYNGKKSVRKKVLRHTMNL